MSYRETSMDLELETQLLALNLPVQLGDLGHAASLSGFNSLIYNPSVGLGAPTEPFPAGLSGL